MTCQNMKYDVLSFHTTFVYTPTFQIHPEKSREKVTQSIHKDKMDDVKAYIAQRLCPGIVVTPQLKELQQIRYAVEALQQGHATLHQSGQKYVCVHKGRPKVTFEQRPTKELYIKLFNRPRDMTPHVRHIHTALKRILKMVRKGTKREINPRRRLVAVKERTCKCGKTYLRACDCGRMSDIHSGAAYREMRDRDDLNGISMAFDSLYSDAFARQTEPRSKWDENTEICPTLARRVAALNQDDIDTQKLKAREIMEEICSRLRFGRDVVNKAHYLFCQYRTMAKKLKYFELSVAACLFHALPTPQKKTVTITMTRKAAVHYGHNPIRAHTIRKDLMRHGFKGPLETALQQYYDSDVTIEVPRDAFRAKKPEGTWCVPGAPKKRTAPHTIRTTKRMKRIDLKKEPTFVIRVNGKDKIVDAKTYRKHRKYGVHI